MRYEVWSGGPRHIWVKFMRNDIPSKSGHIFSNEQVSIKLDIFGVFMPRQTQKGKNFIARVENMFVVSHQS